MDSQERHRNDADTTRQPLDLLGLEQRIFSGDLLEAALCCDSGTFRLIYIDPPYFTGKTFKARGMEGGFRDAWGHIRHYLEFMEERLRALYPLIARDGSLLLHVDWRTVHHMRILCDEIFGVENFQNELIWAYQSGGGTKKRYGRKHDNILWYSKGKNPVFNLDEARVPYDAVIAKKREHLFNPKGKVSGDVLNISRPPNHAKEWTGWPTQKPLELLRFLIKIHSNPGDLVGDFFCGSGTTLAAAAMEGRRVFGADCSPQAVALTLERLRTLTGT